MLRLTGVVNLLEAKKQKIEDKLIKLEERPNSDNDYLIEGLYEELSAIEEALDLLREYA